MELRRNQMKYFSSDNMRLLSSLILSLSSKQSTMENKLIDYWTPSTAYIKDESMVIYDDAIQICKVSNADDTFNQNKWLKLSPDIDELSVDDVKAFLNLTPEEIQTLSSIISDTEVRLDKTWSSSSIYATIQQCLDDSKAFTLAELGKASGASYSVVSSTAEMTDQKYIYLMSDSSGSYDLYIVEDDGSTVQIGNTTINLSNYYTKTEIDGDFLKKTDAASTFATITTADSKVDKTSIITAKNNSATDDQVYSAKAINTELDRVVKKTDIVDNLTSTDTSKPLSANQGKILDDKKLDKADVGKITALNANGVDIKDFILEKCTEKFKEYHIIVAPTCTDLPANNYFYMVVRRTGNNTFKITAKEANCTNEYVRNYRSDTAVWTKWAKVCTTTVADIPKTNIAPADETTFVSFKGNSMCNYCVENGVCYVSLWGVQVTVTGRANTGVILPLPKSGFFGGGELVGGGDAEIHAYAHTIPETGELKFNVKDANVSLYGMFSYPVEG